MSERRSAPSSARVLGARYAPGVALLLALAVWVSVVPSSTPRQAASNVDILSGGADVSGGSVSGGEQAEDAESSSDETGQAVNAPASAAASEGGGQAGGPTGPAGAAGRGAAPRAGTSAAATGDCSRSKVSDMFGCRPPVFTGNNGGSTYRGVTGDTIRVVAYQVRQNEQVQAILSAAGTATNQQREIAFKAIVKWINDNVELYGRKIEPIFHVGTTPANDAAGQQADAVHVAETLNAFAVLTVYPAPIFHEELHRRGILNFTWNQFSAAWFEGLSPHTFGLFPDRDLTLDHLAEYTCKRLLAGSAPTNPNAEHAGDPVYQRAPRKFGVIYQDATDNGPYFAGLLKQKCGKQPAKMLSYPADIGNAVAISTNAVTQMQQEGITTVTCICDVIAPVFFTGQATKQGWFPEWIHNGYFVTDANGAGRLYEPTQWGNSFGVSTLSFPRPIAQNAGYKVCRAGGGDHESCVKGQASYWAFMAMLAASLERLGPNVTDVGVARQLVNLPSLGGEEKADPRYSFGNQGPSPYTYLDDTMEIWYDPAREGNDGERGAAFYVDGGRRYLTGQWPATAPNVFVDDGSPQPARDPDL